MLTTFSKKKIKIRESKYQCVMDLSTEYPIWRLCEIAEISRSAYYKYKTSLKKVNPTIDNLIVDLYNKSGKRAGYRTIKMLLKNKYNVIVNHKKIQRIMRDQSIYSIVRKKFRKPKEQAVTKENTLDRDFIATRPGEKFVTDITYIPTVRKMGYLCTIIDLFNNEPVAWNVSATQDKNLSIDTIKKLAKRFNLEGSLIHSDQGVHYTNLAYVELLKDLKVKQSMSRKGNCWDNAKAESFFSHFKCESIYLLKERLYDIQDVQNLTEEYMDYYINHRPQKSLGGLSPKDYMINYLNQ